MSVLLRSSLGFQVDAEELVDFELDVMVDDENKIGKLDNETGKSFSIT